MNRWLTKKQKLMLETVWIVVPWIAIGYVFSKPAPSTSYIFLTLAKFIGVGGLIVITLNISGGFGWRLQGVKIAFFGTLIGYSAALLVIVWKTLHEPLQTTVFTYFLVMCFIALTREIWRELSA